ncbi:class I SAM-dependent methyltransferase [Acidipila sp. EB88]|uniref:class I SAM-dependent methyltransferase n=1 Tax=Acidipila sp. EB88 TaxID=2305226 RepID=UPI000F5FBFE5|nr:class I SAM-dependent methyltransferase [Acidipila sp. EB88]RRA48162.1 SAM-dependent methyltransferase [Acidipila sp. EB88]
MRKGTPHEPAAAQQAPNPPASNIARSALHVALRRAAHQLYDRPLVFHDPFAVPLLGSEHAHALRRTPLPGAGSRARPWSLALRAFAVARSVYAEQQLATACASGLRQYCILGAGLDTFAWRNPHPGLHVWEMDQLPMQQWKQQLAAAAGLPEPHRVSVPANLADPALAATLTAAGWQPHLPTLFSMLGVAPYLEAAALQQVLHLVRAQGAGSGIVLDYRLPRAALDLEEQQQHDSLAARVAAAAEPFQQGWTPVTMAALLQGFSRVEDLDTATLNARFFANRADGLATRGAAVRLVSAWV